MVVILPPKKKVNAVMGAFSAQHKEMLARQAAEEQRHYDERHKPKRGPGRPRLNKPKPEPKPPRVPAAPRIAMTVTVDLKTYECMAKLTASMMVSRGVLIDRAVKDFEERMRSPKKK